MKKLKSLQKNGFKLAIDDFGVENSNFSRLMELKVDFLKIDGSFIQEICDEKNNSKNIVDAITLFSHKIGTKVIAEFVHNESVEKCLETLDVDFAQGFYIGKPSQKLKD